MFLDERDRGGMASVRKMAATGSGNQEGRRYKIKSSTSFDACLKLVLEDGEVVEKRLGISAWCEPYVLASGHRVGQA